MGGANAAVIVAVLPVAVVWLLTRAPGPRRRSLIGWWVVAVVCACFWWAFSLVIAGKYGYNYLPYTETAASTTSTASVFESLRGASYWTDYDTLGGALLPGAWIIVSSPVVIVGTAVVTALGLAGLCRRVPERLFLVTSLMVGVLAIAAGYAGSSGSPVAHGVQQLLSTSLAPFRNVSKFAPDVALPLALGLASILSIEPRVRATKRPRFSPGASSLVGFVIGLRVLAVAAIVVAALPFLRLQVYGSGGFQAIPSYWAQAGSWLNTHQGNQNALLVPGAGSAQYTWGDPSDEPLYVENDASLLWSDVIPLGSNGSTQMLHIIDQTLDNGTSPPGFAAFLSREGIKYVIERNDLNLIATGAPPPAQVHQVLSETPGLTQVAAFGPILPKHQVAIGSLPIFDSAADLRLHPVEIFRVDSSRSMVHMYPVIDPVVVSGDSGTMLPLEGTQVLGNRATVLSGDPLASRAADAGQALWAISDGNQRRDVAFGSIRNNASYLLGPDQGSAAKPAGVPLNYTVVPGTRHQTVEAPIGLESVSASSFGSSYLYYQSTQGPYSAFDGNLTTAWVANAADNSVGQWISVSFDRPISLSAITISPLLGSQQQPAIRRITVSTDRGTVRRVLPAGKSQVRVTVPTGSSRYLRITIDAVKPASQAPAGIAAGAGIIDIRIPGVSFQQNMKVPDDQTLSFSGPKRNPPIVDFTRPLTNPNLSLGSITTDDPNMARTFTLPKSTNTDITGTAVPEPGPGLESLINLLSPSTSTSQGMTASSWLGDLPRFRPENLIDSSGSPWIAGLGDVRPSISLTWSGLQIIDSVALKPTPFASPPTQVSISGSIGPPQLVTVPPGGGLIHFAPLITDTLRVQFLRVVTKTTVSPVYDSPMTLPVGLASLRVPALQLGTAPAPDQSAVFLLGCGQGPALTVDGASVPTAVSGTVGDLTDLKPVKISTCGTLGGMQLSSGSHSVEAPTTSAPFEISSLLLENPPTVFESGYHVPARPAHVRTWNPASRTIGVGSGPATYLTIPQNYNAAWVATLGGRTLVPVRIDGWQQGYIVPAGQAGTVHLTMVPDGAFRLGLLLGVALLIALLLFALLPAKKSDRNPTDQRSFPFWLLAFATVLGLFIVGGPLALVALPLLWAARRWGGTLMAPVAFVAFVGAGLAVAWNAGALPTTHSGAFGRPAQIASVVALGAVLSATAADGARWKRRVVAGSDPEPDEVPPEAGSPLLEPAARSSTSGETDRSGQERSWPAGPEYRDRS
jgi:arabinofuranan 3-O-arabinosyltransferase